MLDTMVNHITFVQFTHFEENIIRSRFYIAGLALVVLILAMWLRNILGGFYYD